MTTELLKKVYDRGTNVSNDLDFDFWKVELDKVINNCNDNIIIEDYKKEDAEIVAGLVSFGLLESAPDRIKSLTPENSFILWRKLKWLKNYFSL